jgi:hemerythrin
MNEEHESRYVLGFPEMDIQHEYLYCIFDRLENGTTVTDPAAATHLLREIERYLLFHFASEEHLMRTYDFPGFASHQSDHEAAELKLVQFLEDFEMHRLNPAALRIFLTGWLMEHSRSSDSEYVTWITECRGKI